MGGVESHCQELLPRIAALDPAIEIEVVARKPYTPGPPRMFGGVRVTPLFSTRGQSTEAISSTLVGILHAWRRGVDLVHIHAVGPAILTPVARLLGLRVIVTHHGADYNREKWGGFAKTMLRLGERFGASLSHALIAVAPSLAEELRARFPTSAGKIHYVPNGAPDLGGSDSAEVSLLAELGVERDGYVLGVGRLVPEKAFHHLIEAFRASKRGGKLLIVGGADHQSRYSEDLLQQAGPDVIFAGRRSRAELAVLYRCANLFVLPSSHEGLPISALEAGSVGAPMLLSDIQPNRDLGLPAENYFPCGNVTALTACLRRPGTDFAVPAKTFDEFHWDRIAEQTLRLYRSVLDA